MQGVCTPTHATQLSEDCESYLVRLRSRGSKFGIDRIKSVLNHLNNPHKNLKIIHVAGTNGKGSVCMMLERIFREAGYKTGLYLSPHLVYLGERIQINRQPLAPDKIHQYTNEFCTWLEPMIEQADENSPSFFEVMTGMAFHHFAQEQVDIAIIETGLGGRLDATNIVDPLVSIITSIGIDHVEHLGNTHAAIAFEKAGIIKPSKPVIYGWISDSAAHTIETIASKINAPVFSTQKVFGNTIDTYPHVNLIGEHQRKNAATVKLAIQQVQNIFPKITNAIIDNALQNVFVPGCWQMIECTKNKTILCDSAHNEEALRTLDLSLTALRHKYPHKNFIFCVGSTEEYRIPALLSVIPKYAKRIVFMRYHQDRALPPNTLLKYIPSNYTGDIITSDPATIFPAPKKCILGESSDIIVVTGSYYLVGEVLERLLFFKKTKTANLQDLL